MSSLEAVVGELRRASARSSAASYALHAVVAAAAWILAVSLVARIAPIESLRTLVLAGVPLAVAAATIAWLVTQPRPMKLMRTADLKLDLRERLSTAWERRTESGPMAEALRRDALDRASRVKLSRAFGIGWRRDELVAAAVIAVAAVALALTPNPMDQVIAQRHADRTAQSRAAATIEAAKNKLAASASPAPIDPQVQKILQDARARVASAPDPRTALQSITPAEQSLLSLSDPQTPARATSAQNLANNLGGTNGGASAGRALTSSPRQGAQALRQLASQLQNLSAADRAQLAQALAASAQQSKDPALAASLSQAATALSQGNLAAASQALDAVAGQLDSLQDQESNDQEIASAINGLEAARQQLAAQADQDAGSAPAASASPSAAASGSGQGSGNGNGNGNGSGNANGNGSGNGTGQGTGGTGGQGASGSGSGSGTPAQSTERVYVPAPAAAGQTENDPTPLGPGQDVPLTPYGQVIVAYQQAALDSAQQSLIPGSEQDLIREYFSSLGEPSGGG